MKSFLLFTAFNLLVLSTFSQVPTFNFDIEELDHNIPKNWDQFGSANYTAQSDSIHVKNGKRSLSLAFTGGASDFSAVAFTIPKSYEGKEITLSGYVKTENVEDGYAGLWMRIDPGIGFDNMRDRGIKGTKDWTQCEITLDLYPEDTERIVIGGILVGKGKMWIDQLSVSIDGKAIETLEPYQKELLPADVDTAFIEGSKVDEIQLTDAVSQELSRLGMIWGFLKYHHPAVARGEYNWDFELFRILPQILAAENSEACDNIYLDWIKRLGSVKKGKKPTYNADEVKLTPDLSWTETSGFSKQLMTELEKIRYAKRPKEHYYINYSTGANNPEFKHEEAYSKMNYPDAGFRLLSLYRYWNIIQYHFPYKNLIEEDWKPVLKEFIPAFVEAEDRTAYELACLKVIEHIHDSHANIWSSSAKMNEYWGANYSNLNVSFVENKAVVTGYIDENLRHTNELKIGDVITKINDVPVEQIVANRLPLTPASNHPTKLRNLARKLLRSNDTIIPISYERGGEIFSTTLPAYPVSKIDFRSGNDADTSFRMISEDIAYIDHGALKTAHLPSIWEAIKNTKGLIIDDRNYPSDFPIYELSKLLMPKKTPFVKFTEGSVQNPGYFIFTESLTVGQKNNDHYQGKVIILLNETTQSSAEFHAMAYRVHPNSIVIGSITSGADGNVSRFYLPGKIATMISGIGVYYPDGTETQRVGIVPDIECRPTIEGIREGRDEVLDKAIEVILR